MSEEILEQQSEEELEEAKVAAVKSSGRKIKEQDDEEEGDEEEVKEENGDEEEGDEEEKEVKEAVSVPKTKAGMIKALYNQLNAMKKADLSDSFSKIMGSTLTEDEYE